MGPISVRNMGSIDIERDRDFWDHTLLGQGSASTTNPSIVDDKKKNPIGFIWIEEEEENGERIQHC